jgi:hypothetical protein
MVVQIVQRKYILKQKEKESVKNKEKVYLVTVLKLKYLIKSNTIL